MALLVLFEEPEAAEQVANNTHTGTNIESGTLPSTPVCHEKSAMGKIHSSSFKELLQGAENVVYEARNDS